MSARHKLTAEEKKFFTLIAEAVFANPFSDERLEIDRRILGGSGDRPRLDRVRLLREKVATRVSSLETEGRCQLGDYSAQDREILRVAFLFEAYHLFFDAFADLIDEQKRHGDEPCKVSFATEALSLLRKRGFPAEEATRFFAMLYQLRRAHYFIDGGLVGASASMKRLRAHLWNNVITHDIQCYGLHLFDRMEDFSTMLLGETGTGKGTAAAAIGQSGFIPFDNERQCFLESFTRAFISINLSQYPEELIESELFGHRKGAFTGAIDHHEGVFQRCSPHGAIFLDEIGDVSVRTQIKLLQVLQDRFFSPVGNREQHKFRGRVIAATNRPIHELRCAGEFRDDFYYRLCSDIILVPPLRDQLRECPADLDGLLRHILERMTGGSLSEDQFDGLFNRIQRAIADSVPADYDWPGNVRELEQCVRRVLLTNRYDPCKGAVPREGGQQELFDQIERGSLNAQDLVAGYCALLYERHKTFAEVARRTELDRRTVKKYLDEIGALDGDEAAQQ
jgi:DNA-binding NtrC family response regulator